MQPRTSVRLNIDEWHLLEAGPGARRSRPLPRNPDLRPADAEVDSKEQVIPVLHGVSWEPLGSYIPLLTLKKDLRLDDRAVGEIAEMIASTL